MRRVINIAFHGPGEDFGARFSQTGDSVLEIDASVLDVSPQTVNCPIDLSKLAILIIQSNLPATFTFHNSGADEAFTLGIGMPLLWSRASGQNCPLSRDPTSLTISVELGQADIKLRALLGDFLTGDSTTITADSTTHTADEN